MYILPKLSELSKSLISTEFYINPTSPLLASIFKGKLGVFGNLENGHILTKKSRLFYDFTILLTEVKQGKNHLTVTLATSLGIPI